MSDWIKIHRSVLDSYSFANPDTFKVWIWMLLKANYKKSFVPLKCGTGVTSIKVERGQFIFGRNKAQDELKISGSSIYRILQKFEDLGQIIIEPNNQYSLITICNYGTYQNMKDKDEQPADNQRTTSGQQMNSEWTATEHIKEELEYKEEIPYARESGLVLEMANIFKSFNTSMDIEPELHYPPCLQIAYRIAKKKGWQKHEVLNGKMQETLDSWKKIVEFVKADEWLATRSLIDLNTQKEWDRLVSKMQLAKTPILKKETIGSPIKKETEIDWEKYKGKK